jgi:DNA-binding protein H-NS
MPTDDLWELHQRVIEVLDRRLENEKRKLQNRLDELGRKFADNSQDVPQRRPYPKIEQKFQNPDDPLKTWSGRGRSPRWVVELLAAGRRLEEFRIERDAPTKPYDGQSDR